MCKQLHPRPIELNAGDQEGAFAQRKNRNRSVRTTVVKCGLATRLLRPSLRAPIDELVAYVTKVCHRTGLIVDYVVRQAVENCEAVPDVLDQTFVDRAMSLTWDARMEEPALQDAWDEGHFSKLPPIRRPMRTGKIAAQSARTTVMTNMKNCVTEAFWSRLGKYMKAWCQLHGISHRRVNVLRKCVMGLATEEEASTLAPAEDQIVRTERASLGLGWQMPALRGPTQPKLAFDSVQVSDVWRKCASSLTKLRVTRAFGFHVL